MQNASIGLLEVLLPALILVLAFVLKLFIDRAVTTADAIFAFFELPVDVAFLSLTLIAAFTMAKEENVRTGILSFIVYVVGSIIVVVLWRRSRHFFELDKFKTSLTTCAGSYAVCLYGLWHAITLLTSAPQ